MLYNPPTDDAVRIAFSGSFPELRANVARLHAGFLWQERVRRLKTLDERLRKKPSRSRDQGTHETGNATLRFVSCATSCRSEATTKARSELSWQLTSWDRFRIRFSRHSASIDPSDRSKRVAPAQLAAALEYQQAWIRRADCDESQLNAARMILREFLDAPPVDLWGGYYEVTAVVIQSVRRLARTILRADAPIRVTIPFTLEPYIVTLLKEPDYPTNLLLANLFL